LKPCKGQRWQFINKSFIINYIAEIYSIDPLQCLVLQMILDDLNASGHHVGKIFPPKLLTLDGPKELTAQGALFSYLEGQDKS
jgi:hypothetical protein